MTYYISKFTFEHNIPQGYGQHQKVWEIFEGSSHKKKRDFIFEWNENTLLAISKNLPRNLPPKCSFESKPFSVTGQKGMSFRFSVKVNAFVAYRDNDDKKKVRDVFSRYAELHPELDSSTSRLNAGLEWFNKRKDKFGFTLSSENVLFEEPMVETYVKNNRQKIVIVTSNVSGILTVIDEDNFRNVLVQGVGPKAGFGCGMLKILGRI